MTARRVWPRLSVDVITHVLQIAGAAVGTTVCIVGPTAIAGGGGDVACPLIGHETRRHVTILT